MRFDPKSPPRFAWVRDGDTRELVTARNARKRGIYHVQTVNSYWWGVFQIRVARRRRHVSATLPYTEHHG
jgi:hypothetical protein